MDILIVSNSDTCRSRMAQEILNSFGSGMKICTAGVLAGNIIPDVACRVMERNGYSLSRKKPCDVRTYVRQSWDYVITFCQEAEEAEEEMADMQNNLFTSILMTLSRVELLKRVSRNSK